MGNRRRAVAKGRVRLAMYVSAETARFLEELAISEGCTMTEVVRRGLSVLKAFQQQREVGRCHMGFVSDRTKLDSEIIGILT